MRVLLELLRELLPQDFKEMVFANFEYFSRAKLQVEVCPLPRCLRNFDRTIIVPEEVEILFN